MVFSLSIRAWRITLRIHGSKKSYFLITNATFRPHLPGFITFDSKCGVKPSNVVRNGLMWWKLGRIHKFGSRTLGHDQGLSIDPLLCLAHHARMLNVGVPFMLNQPPPLPDTCQPDLLRWHLAALLQPYQPYQDNIYRRISTFAMFYQPMPANPAIHERILSLHGICCVEGFEQLLQHCSKSVTRGCTLLQPYHDNIYPRMPRFGWFLLQL